MTPGIVGAATRTPHVPKDDANTGLLVSFGRSGIASTLERVGLSEHFGAGRGVRFGPEMVPNQRWSSILFGAVSAAGARQERRLPL